ncbi:MAG: hypothetical protein AAF688_12475, partial [Bacteroidota bacterium]
FKSSNNFNSSLFLFDEQNNQLELGPDFINNSVYEIKGFNLSSKYKLILGEFDFNINLDSSWFDLEYTDITLGFENSPFNFVPTLAIKYKASKVDNFAFIYSRNIINLPIDYVLPNFIQTGFDFLQRGSNSTSQERTNFFLFDYKRGDWTKDFLFNGQLLYANGENAIGNILEISQSFTTLSRAFFSNQNTFNGNASLDRYFKFLKSNLKLNISYTKNWTDDILNGVEREINGQTTNISLEMRSAFDVFNYHFGIRSSLSKIETTTESENAYLYNFLDLSLNFSKKGTISLENEYYSFRNSTNQNADFLFTDLAANYILKKNKLNLNLSARNLWNTESASFVFLNDFSRSEFNYTLFPRIFMIGLDYRF